MERKSSILQTNVSTPCSTKSIENAALSVLEYFGLFSYPLNAEEILSFCSVSSSRTEVLCALTELEIQDKVYKYKCYYCTKPNIEQQVAQREYGNKLAITKTIDAKRIGNFIYNFPFVKFVGISGSLSKGCASDKCDYDFFIITSQNRLWICRTLLHLFKKMTFLAGQQDKFCMNYFVDESALKIEEKNRFTATELITLIPVNGNAVYNRFINANNWIQSFFPNHTLNLCTHENNKPLKIVKKSLEYILDHFSPGKSNSFLMKLTDIKWRRKWARKNFPMNDYELAFKTTLHVSKNHPLNHQKKVLNSLSRAKT